MGGLIDLVPVLRMAYGKQLSFAIGIADLAAVSGMVTGLR